MADSYDVIVPGAGPTGENVADRAASNATLAQPAATLAVAAVCLG